MLSAACLAPNAPAAELPSPERGKYVFTAAGCYACHTDTRSNGLPLAGGGPLHTPFGTFYAPNITPDPEHGIGRWSDVQFLRAMREGIAPDGNHYYPVFPYPAYTKATEQDLLDLRAYLNTLPPVSRVSRPHDVDFPFSIRAFLSVWKWLNFEPGEWRPDPLQPAAWNRGAYLVQALGHCGECHTPRSKLGGLDRSRWMAGGLLGTGKVKAPNLTPHETGLATWTESDIVFALELGILPEGGTIGEEMRDVVQYGTSRLTAEDRRAIADYLKTLPPLPSAVPHSR